MDQSCNLDVFCDNHGILAYATVHYKEFGKELVFSDKVEIRNRLNTTEDSISTTVYSR